MIELEEVTKIYPRKGESDVVALNNISLNIPAGEIHGIVGESGAGKSTLIRCLTALESPTSGEIRVDGQNLTTLGVRDLRAARRKIGMVFQGANLLDARTAAQNISYPLKLSGVSLAERKQRTAELLTLVGLGARGRSYPSQLSGGQRQRVGIARALADNPPVLLCDEPTSALDSETTGQILDLIVKLRDHLGVTVLIITHEMDVVRRICDSVTLLDHGSVRETGTVSQIFDNPTSELAQLLIPLPSVEASRPGEALLDIIFTSHPGEPTGSAVMELVRAQGADIAAGAFETLRGIQVGRLALSLPQEEAGKALMVFKEAGIRAEVRLP